jgi:hypothetical protein
LPAKFFGLSINYCDNFDCKILRTEFVCQLWLVTFVKMNFAG